MKSPILTNPCHLCDLLNFVLVLGHHHELPKKDPLQRVRITKPGIDFLVVKSWNSGIKHDAEAWADARLREVQTGPRQAPRFGYAPGRKPGRFLPRELMHWTPRRLGGTA